MVHQNELQVIQQLEVEPLQAISKKQNEKVIGFYEKGEHLFEKGNSQTRTVISNVFILPLSQLLEANCTRGREYLRLLPTQLKVKYRRQIYLSGITNLHS